MTDVNNTLSTAPASPPSSPNIVNWILGFLLVGIAWGFTTPFIRRAAIHFDPPRHASLDRIDPKSSRINWLKYRILKAAWTIIDLLKSPAYALPLLLNVTGSIWFFLLIGQAGEQFSSRFELEFGGRQEIVRY